MFRLFSRCVSRSSLPRGKKTQRAQLRVEALETREVPSAASLLPLASNLLPLDTHALFNHEGQVTHTGPAAEEHIAVSPMNSNHLVAAISDFSLRGGYNTTKYAYSTDNGTSWTEAFVPLDANNKPTTGDGQSWEANSDPVVAIANDGTVYLADLYFNGSNDANGLYVSVAGLNPGSGAFTAPTASTTYAVAKNLSPTTNVFEDKEWIAVDNSTGLTTSGNVYASWTRFVGNFTDYIMFSRSSDQGQTWSTTPIQVSPGSQNGAVQGSQIAVGPTGTIYVAYEVFYVGGRGAIFLTSSINGGGTWTPAHAITPLFKNLNFQSTYRKNSFPALAVGPDNTVYVTYADQKSSSSSKIEFIYSTTAGASFTAPSVISNFSGQQFMPAITVDSINGNNQVWVSWFDTRNSLSGTKYYDIYAASLTSLTTKSWSVRRVTSASIYAGSASFIGDYAGIAAGDGFAHPVWTSGGFNGGRLQTATLTL